uniref:RRM domain-containing protein n=1 Tax=Gongylonema pulchrum TaxID=637853 RepID=A0A183DKR3_9BILA
LARAQAAAEAKNEVWTIRTKKLLVLGIPHNTSVQEIIDYFSEWGFVEKVHICTNFTPGIVVMQALFDYAFVFYTAYEEVSVKLFFFFF